MVKSEWLKVGNKKWKVESRKIIAIDYLLTTNY